MKLRLIIVFLTSRVNSVSFFIIKPHFFKFPYKGKIDQLLPSTNHKTFLKMFL